MKTPSDPHSPWSGTARPSWAVALALVSVLLTSTVGKEARAQSCVRIGGLYRSAGCPAETERRRLEDRARPAPGREMQQPFPSSDFRLPLPVLPTKEGPLTLADLQLSPDGAGGHRGRRPGFKFRIAPDGGITFEDGAGVGASSPLTVAFDLTDFLMRLHGDDPYVYDKALVVKLTGPMRAAMADRDRERRLERALIDLPASLARLWRRPDLEASTRRALIFLLWDELAERGDDLEGAAADEARALIVRFVRIHLPESSAAGYTRAELERFNRGRRSQPAFAPYQR